MFLWNFITALMPPLLFFQFHDLIVEKSIHLHTLKTNKLLLFKEKGGFDKI